MIMGRFFATLCVFLALMAVSTVHGAEVSTPQPGSPERKDILDGVRAYVATDLPRPVKFLVHKLNVKDGWAFLLATPQQSNGRPYDYQGTRYEEFIQEGLFDDNVCALLERGQSAWHVLALVIGATDVPYEGWSDEFGAPSEIFR